MTNYFYDDDSLNVLHETEGQDQVVRSYIYSEASQLIAMSSRYYNPEHGVFLSLDPDPGDEDDILTQNGYSYANNNPVKYVDPDGHWVWMAIGGLVGGVSSYK